MRVGVDSNARDIISLFEGTFMPTVKSDAKPFTTITAVDLANVAGGQNKTDAGGQKPNQVLKMVESADKALAGGCTSLFGKEARKPCNWFFTGNDDGK